MQKNNNMLLRELQRLLVQKKSKQFYAEKLGISVKEVNTLLDELRGVEQESEVIPDESYSKHNIEKGTIEISAYYDHAPTAEDIIADHKIDTEKYKLAAFWSKQKAKGYQVSAFFTQISKQDNFSKNFQEFINEYKYTSPIVRKTKKAPSTPESFCLVFPKQDSHMNKYDIKGENNIDARLSNLEEKTEVVLAKAQQFGNLEKVVYIIGSDQLNSEFTGTTTKGTEQTNVGSYHESFKRVCDHEINVINILLDYADFVDIIYVPGNHDEYAGWHIISWLKAYFRNQENLDFDIEPSYTKFIKYGRNALMFNHGDAMKPEKLAQIFPIEFKEYWSSCDNYTIFTGDKHHDVSKDIGGISFYQVPALSNSKSLWDSKNGHTTTPARLSAFLIERYDGVVNIFKPKI